MDDLRDRRVLQAALNDISEKYNSKKLEMDKLSTATPESKGKLRQMALDKAKELIGQSDDLNKLNQGQSLRIAGASPAPLDPNEVIGRIKSGPENVINTKPMMKEITGGEFVSKISGLKKAGKKLAGIIPLVGTGMAMMDSPAASASEMIRDPKVQRAAFSEIAGPVGDAIDIGGDIAEAGLDKYRDVKDNKDMSGAEKKALRNYKSSPAAMDKIGMDEGDRDSQALLEARKKALMGY